MEKLAKTEAARTMLSIVVALCEKFVDVPVSASWRARAHTHERAFMGRIRRRSGSTFAQTGGMSFCTQPVGWLHLCVVRDHG
jgi:hypothetical protein